MNVHRRVKVLNTLKREEKESNTYDMRPPRKATGLPPISLILRWHESNRPDVVVGAVAVGPIICAGDRNILTRLFKPSIFVNVLKILSVAFSKIVLSSNMVFKSFLLEFFFHFLYMIFMQTCVKLLRDFRCYTSANFLLFHSYNTKLLAQSNFLD